MNDPGRMLALERVRDLDPVTNHIGKRQRTTSEPIGKRLSFDVLHDEIVATVVVTDVVERADMRIVQL